MALNLPRLQRLVALVDKVGNPTATFHQWWQSVAKSIEDAFVSIEGNTADIAANTADLSAAAVSLASLDARIDAYDALAPFVRADQTTTWATPTGTFDRTTWAAPTSFTVSSPPTQAEVQAIAAHVVLLSQHMAALISDLRGNNALT